jgi:Outer membrane protein beta-barrel domain
MKKNIMVLLLAAVCTIAQAQVNIGVKTGLNRYALTGDDQSYKNSLHAGVFAQIPLNGLLVIQPELLFSSEGNAFEENDIKSGQYLGYVNIPVMLRLNTKGGFYAEAGLQFGFLLSAKYKETGSKDEDIKKYFKGSNLSLGAGAGYQFKMGLGIGARYNFGLSNLMKDKSFDAMKSIGLQAGIFYTFSTKKK